MEGQEVCPALPEKSLFWWLNSEKNTAGFFTCLEDKNTSMVEREKQPSKREMIGSWPFNAFKKKSSLSPLHSDSLQINVSTAPLKDNTCSVGPANSNTHIPSGFWYYDEIEEVTESLPHPRNFISPVVKEPSSGALYRLLKRLEIPSSEEKMPPALTESEEACSESFCNFFSK